VAGTTDRTNPTSVVLASDTAATFGAGTTAFRGWTVNKNASTAELAFNYENTDTVGQVAVPEYTVMQLDGLNNQVQLPTAATQIVFVGDTNLYRASANVLKTDDSFVVNGTLSLPALSTAGIVHNNASGLLSSSLIVNADVAASAGIVDTKLATIATAGKVANSATSATSANTASTIVARDASGNFSTAMVTLTGTTTNATDAATKAYVDSVVGSPGTSLNTPNTTVRRDATGSFAAETISLVDGVASGIITASAGSAATPSFKFAGSTNTGLSAATTNTLSFDTNGIERMSIGTAAIAAQIPYCNQAIQEFTITANNQSVTAASTTSVLLLITTANRTGLRITFPSSPTNGQYFTILLAATNNVSVVNITAPAVLVNGITSFSSALGASSVTYFYYAPTNRWYRERTS
jgi:hypothetical protein